MVRLLGDLGLIIDLFGYIWEWYNEDGDDELLKPLKDEGDLVPKASCKHVPFLPPISPIRDPIMRKEDLLSLLHF